MSHRPTDLESSSVRLHHECRSIPRTYALGLADRFLWHCDSLGGAGAIKTIFQYNLKFWRVMKILATRIAKELKSGKLCTVYEPELTRIWPDEKTRPAQIASFAKQHGWQVFFYSHGFFAVFDREPSC